MLNGYASYIGTINGMKRDEALGADFKQLVPVDDTLTFTGWCIAYKRNIIRYEYKLDDGAWTDANAALSAYENPDELKGQFIKDDNFDTEKAVYSLTVNTADLAAGAHTIALRAVMNDGSYGLILRKTRDVPAEIDFTVPEREVPTETETESETETETETVTKTPAAESTTVEETTATPTDTATAPESETTADSAKDSVTGTAATSETGTDVAKASDSGCESVIAGGALVILSMLSLGGFALRKKQ